ncbi:MAG: hypoxanthine phosphoribosyltransferase [Lachnospiraceae bacterium]|nr:hypoxanthine phosphoribosyltransferase [Lachnospiraceae bacterium]
MTDKIRLLFTEEQIDARIREIGKQITEEYEGKEIVLVCALKGASFFACELAKRISLDVKMDFISLSSYGSGKTSSGEVRMLKDLDFSIDGKNVIVVEDIVDTGRTLSYVMGLLETRKPESLKLCSLLDKPSRRVVDIQADYVGFEVPDLFVVGYGLDFDQKYRNLPYIGVVEND